MFLVLAPNESASPRSQILYLASEYGGHLVNLSINTEITEGITQKAPALIKYYYLLIVTTYYLVCNGVPFRAQVGLFVCGFNLGRQDEPTSWQIKRVSLFSPDVLVGILWYGAVSALSGCDEYIPPVAATAPGVCFDFSANAVDLIIIITAPPWRWKRLQTPEWQVKARR